MFGFGYINSEIQIRHSKPRSNSNEIYNSGPLTKIVTVSSQDKSEGLSVEHCRTLARTYVYVTTSAPFSLKEEHRLSSHGMETPVVRWHSSTGQVGKGFSTGSK
jgi:hypothetical protein